MLRSISFRSVALAALTGAMLALSPAAMAESHGGGGSGFHGGGGFHDGYHGYGGRGWGWGGGSVFIGGFGGWPYYGYPYYGYDPYYYGYPPPVAYAPPVTYYGAPAATAPQAVAQAPAATSVDRSYCRQFQGTVMIDGKAQPSSGTACRQPDGTWRVVP